MAGKKATTSVSAVNAKSTKPAAGQTGSDSSNSSSSGSVGLGTHFLFVGIIVAIVGVCYSNALEGAFCFDDYYAIVKNPDMFNQASFLQLWGKDFWGTSIGSNSSHKSYRPLCVTSFKLDRVIGEWLYGIKPYVPEPSQPAPDAKPASDADDDADERLVTPAALSPFFHKVNVAYYALSCVLAYFFAVYVTGGDALFAFVGAALFAAHPIHTEAVTGLVGRAEVLCVVFSMLAFFAYGRGVTLMRREERSCCARGYLCVLLAMVFMCCGTLCKETGLTISGVFVMYDLLYGLPNPPTKFTELLNIRRYFGSGSGSGSSGFWARVATTLCTVAGFTAFRIHINHGFSNPTTRFVESPLKYIHGLRWLLSLAFNHAKYLQLLVYPHTMSCDYSHSCIPLVESLGDPRNALSAAAYLALAALAALCLWTFSRRALVFFALMMCTAFPLSNLILSVGTMIGERLLFFPTLGSCMLAACPLVWLFRRPGAARKAAAALLFGAALLGYALRTYRRNPDWDTPEKLFESALEVCPHSAKVHYNLALQAQGRGEWNKSMEHFRLARAYGPPSYCDPDYGIGVSMLNSGDIRGGIDQIKKSLDCDYVRVPAFRGLRSYYSNIIGRNPENRTLIYEWTLILAKINRTEDATKRLHSLVGLAWSEVK